MLELRVRAKDLRDCVLDCDHWFGIVTRGEPYRRLDLNPDEIGSMSFEHFDRNRVELLDLQPPEALGEILAAL